MSVLWIIRTSSEPNVSALAGSEFALAANLAGYLFAFKSAHRYLVSRDGQITQRIVTVICGMGCYFFPWPAARLLGVTIGTWAGWSAMFGTWPRVKGSQEMIAEGQSGLTVEL